MGAQDDDVDDDDDDEDEDIEQDSSESDSDEEDDGRASREHNPMKMIPVLKNLSQTKMVMRTMMTRRIRRS
jgi:hypothetical protein